MQVRVHEARAVGLCLGSCRCVAAWILQPTFQYVAAHRRLTWRTATAGHIDVGAGEEHRMPHHRLQWAPCCVCLAHGTSTLRKRRRMNKQATSRRRASHLVWQHQRHSVAEQLYHAPIVKLKAHTIARAAIRSVHDWTKHSCALRIARVHRHRQLHKARCTRAARALIGLDLEWAAVEHSTHQCEHTNALVGIVVTCKCEVVRIAECTHRRGWRWRRWTALAMVDFRRQATAITRTTHGDADFAKRTWRRRRWGGRRSRCRR